MYDDGKTEAVVIGHSSKANPNINGDKTTIKGQDYRHGGRIIYHNGKVLFTTKVKRHLGKEVIKIYLDKKKKAEDAKEEYDGTKEEYKKK